MSDGTLVSTMLAGTIASFAESTITFPLEYVKTRRQLATRPLAASNLPPFKIPHLTSVFYQGWSAFVVGNTIKTWLRFRVFNSATKFMSEGQEKRPGAPVVVVSGMMTGIVETMVVVPFENIKTTMIEASSIGKGAAEGALPPLGAPNTRLLNQATSQANPNKLNDSPRKINQVKGSVRPVAKQVPSTGIHPIAEKLGMLRTIRDMYQHRGLRAFLQGFNPTVTRQVTNSVLRFTSWNALAQLMSPDGEEKMSLQALLIGSGAAAAVEALATQPLDVVKTRMQSANGRVLYGNSLVCAYKIFTEEGWKQFWAGIAPRWVRKWVGGGIMWACYELSYEQISGAMRENPFK